MTRTTAPPRPGPTATGRRSRPLSLGLEDLEWRRVLSPLAGPLPHPPGPAAEVAGRSSGPIRLIDGSTPAEVSGSLAPGAGPDLFEVAGGAGGYRVMIATPPGFGPGSLTVAYLEGEHAVTLPTSPTPDGRVTAVIPASGRPLRLEVGRVPAATGGAALPYRLQVKQTSTAGADGGDDGTGGGTSAYFLGVPTDEATPAAESHPAARQPTARPIAAKSPDDEDERRMAPGTLQTRPNSTWVGREAGSESDAETPILADQGEAPTDPDRPGGVDGALPALPGGEGSAWVWVAPLELPSPTADVINASRSVSWGPLDAAAGISLVAEHADAPPVVGTAAVPEPASVLPALGLGVLGATALYVRAAKVYKSLRLDPVGGDPPSPRPRMPPSRP